MSKTSRIFDLPLVFLLCSFAPPAIADDTAEAGKLARNAFFALESKPFDGKTGRKAYEDIKNAYERAPKHPWVAIAVSRQHLESGYKKGDRSKLSSYEAFHVERANRYARQAVELGAGESMAHVQLARIQIITENYKGAWETLNQAHKLDPEGFYPWYYRSVIATLMKDPKRAGEALSEAEKRAVLPFQKGWTISRRIDLARLNKDREAEEKYYKQVIEHDATEAHHYGNYAQFLKRHKRYDEAIAYFEKAIAIRSYPLAEQQLRQTRLLRDSSSK